MKNVIITGAAGFIGANMVKKLSQENMNVFAIVRNKEKAERSCKLNNVKFIECEMCDYSNLYRKVKNIRGDVFYHFAWEGHNGKERSDYKLQLKNVEYTCEAIKLARELGCKKFIFPGSLIEYEYKKSLDNNLYNVSMSNIYGIAKMTARQMGQVLSKNIGIDFIPTTISNIYGVGEKADRLFKSTLKKLMLKEKTEFTECEQMYDFIYIDDAVEAFYEVGKNGQAFKNYYIGNCKPKKLKEFICQIRDNIDKNAELGFGKIPFNGISLTYDEFDTELLYKEFGFEPKVTFLEGIKRTKKWLEEEGL